MPKEQHIEFWRTNSNEDWETMFDLLWCGKKVYALYFVFLSIEKLLFACWIKDNASNTPPMTHDLKLLANQTDLELTGEQYNLIGVIQSWNIETRYPDYKKNLHRIATEKYLNDQINEVNPLRLCLLERCSTTT